jgi:electron transfer flavoprotein beta subunit
MHILVILKMAPDVVEELEIAPDGKALDPDYLRMIPSEFDDHALEQAILLKERHGGKVTVVALDAPELDDALFTALAKGADRAVKIVDAEPETATAQAARLLARVLSEAEGLLPADLILTGVQAVDDLDGLMAPLLAYELKMPFLGIVTGLSVGPVGNTAVAVKEFPGGVRGQFEVGLPAVLGIQAAEKPPRYVPVAKVRAAMKSQKIESVPVPALADGHPLIECLRMEKPQAATHAEMLEGSPEEVSGRLCEILAGRGVL